MAVQREAGTAVAHRDETLAGLAAFRAQPWPPHKVAEPRSVASEMSVFRKLCLALALLGGLIVAAPQGASALPVTTAAGLAGMPDSGLVEVRYRRHWRRHHRHRWHRHHHRRWHHHRRHRHWHHRRHRHHWGHHRPLRFTLGRAPRVRAVAAPWRDPIRRTGGSLTPRLD